MLISPDHIHPMIVHFPIVFFLSAVALQFIVMVRGGDLAEHKCLPNITLVTLILAALAAMAAAFFGDMAYDIARSKGFPVGPLSTHADLGLTTMWIIIVLAVIQLFCWWRRISLAGGRGWFMFLLGLIGIGFLLVTAYHGGDLVYHLGVNVDAVTPK